MYRERKTENQLIIQKTQETAELTAAYYIYSKMHTKQAHGGGWVKPSCSLDGYV